MQHTAKQCNTLNHTATHCTTLQPTAAHCNPLSPPDRIIHRNTAPRCNTLHHTAPHCTTLHHNASQCTTMQPHYTALHHIATHCNLCNPLQLTEKYTTHYNTPLPPECNTRASDLRHDVFNRIGPLKLDHQAKPSALAAVPFDLGMPRTPERAYLALARAAVIQALDTVLASPVSH